MIFDKKCNKSEVIIVFIEIEICQKDISKHAQTFKFFEMTTKSIFLS